MVHCRCLLSLPSHFGIAKWLIGFCSIFIFTPTYAQQVARVSPAGTKFWAYTPPGYSAGTPAPLLVVLHGGSGIGDDLNIIIQDGHLLPAKLINRGEWDTSLPFIVISPQLKRDPAFPNYNDQEWPPSMVHEVIEYVKTQYSVNQNKVYMTGISLGGAGTWWYAITYPANLAAIMPMSGVTHPDPGKGISKLAQACALKDIPIWVFHGENDGLVTPTHSINMVEAISNCQNAAFKPRLNLIPAQAHEGWGDIYNRQQGYDIYSWLLSFTKNALGNRPPHVSIGGNKKILLRTGPFYIPGDYFDSDGQIASVVWQKVSGPSVVMEEVNGPNLKISGLQAGVYEFRLRVTDNGGLVGEDTMQLTVTSGETTPQILSLTLTDAAEVPIRALNENDLINLTTLGSDQINILATGNGSTASIRFSANVFNLVKLVSASQATMVRPGIAWIPSQGDFVLCATPYSGSNASGTMGISQCFKVTVGVDKYYAKMNNSDISLLSSWGSNPDGTGTSPASLSSSPMQLIVPGTSFIGNDLTLHQSTKVVIASGGSLNFSKRLLYPDGAVLRTFANVFAEGNSTIRINANNVALKNLSSESTTIIESSAGVVIPTAIYGALTLKGTGNKSINNNAVVTIKRKFTIESGTPVLNSVPLDGKFSALGDVDILWTTAFTPSRPFPIVFGSGGTQNFRLNTTRSVFQTIEVGKNTTVNLLHNTAPGTLEVGSTAGPGDLIIGQNGNLKMNGGTLSLKSDVAINNGNQTGTIDLDNSSLLMDVSTSRNSNFYPKRGMHSLKRLEAKIIGSGQLQIRDSLKIKEYIKVAEGTVQSNGFVNLVSTAGLSAYLAPKTGTGLLSGIVNVERYIEPGKKYKYLGFPVKNLTVAQLQNSIPVTGTFPQTSVGPGLTTNPSLFHYHEPGAGWVDYPANSNTEALVLGKGYAVFMRNETVSEKITLRGELHQGDFTFTLTPDPDINVEENGWNLLGNPYVATIKWGATGWTVNGVNTAVYVKDNSYPGGRFMVWDGITGDTEFEGNIAPGQAFWVRTTTANPQLIVSESAKVPRGDVRLYGTADEDEPKFIRLSLQKDFLPDNVFLKFHDKGSGEFQTDTDAVKQKNGYFNISVLTEDSVSVAIKNLPKPGCSRTIRLHFEAGEKGGYSISARGNSWPERISNVLLVDSFADTTVVLDPLNEYVFNVTTDQESFATDRFKLVIDGSGIDAKIIVTGNTLSSDYSSGNQWMRDGVEIPGATGQTYEATEPGNYQLRITKGQCSKVSEGYNLRITDILAENEGVFFPNPARNFIRIRGNHVMQFQRFRIISTSGTTASEGYVENEGSEGLIRLNDINAGVYFLELEKRDGVRRFKLMIQ